MAEPESGNGTSRLEAFSDGVFAIAITLLVLDIKVPKVSELPAGKTLTEALLDSWPVYLAYVTSFLTILIMWVNHHNLFKNIKRTDQTFLLINGLLLMVVSLVPFPTSLLAEYIQEPQQNVAAIVFSGTYLLIALIFNALWRYASHNDRLLGANVDRAFVQNVNRQYAFGPFLYLVCFAAAFFNGMISFLIALALAVFFALPVKAFSISSNSPTSSSD